MTLDEIRFALYIDDVHILETFQIFGMSYLFQLPKYEIKINNISYNITKK